jgi:hypothetical protein
MLCKQLLIIKKTTDATKMWSDRHAYPGIKNSSCILKYQQSCGVNIFKTWTLWKLIPAKIVFNKYMMT